MRHSEEENANELKAVLLAKVLEKHNPEQCRELALRLMQKYGKESEEFKCFAALYEIMDIFKV